MRVLGTMAVIGAAALVMTGCAAGHSDPRPGRSHAPSSSGEAHVVEFSITGDARLRTLTYIIDGKTTKLTSVGLPWKKTVRLPADGKHTWRLSTKQDGGMAQIVVTVDGRPLTNSSCQGDGCHGSADGSIG